MSSEADISDAIVNHLKSKSLGPNRAWLKTFIEFSRPNTPLPSLQGTALFRLLASDITTSLDQSRVSCFPPDITNVEVKEKKLSGTIAVQVLDIEDLGRSRWSQIELLEQQERGEMTKGREIIRLAPDSEDNDLATNQHLQQDKKSKGPHKLLLQDARGTKVFGFELFPVDKVNLQMSIGTKLMLSNATVARGVVLLEPRCVQILGGKIDAWDKEWRKGQKESLKRNMNLDPRAD